MRKPGLPPEHFEQQFPHSDKFEDPGKPVTPWWELKAHKASGGAVVDKALTTVRQAMKSGGK